MNLTKWDIKVMVAMMSVVLFFSLVFVQLPFVADSSDNIETELPELDINEDSFQSFEEYPTRPSMGAFGSLVYTEQSPSSDYREQIYRDGDGNYLEYRLSADGEQIELRENVDGSQATLILIPIGDDEPNDKRDLEGNRYEIDTSNRNVDREDDWDVQPTLNEANDTDVVFEVVNVRVEEDPSQIESITVEYEITGERSGDGSAGLLSSVPFIGSTLDQTVDGVLYIFGLALWFVSWVIGWTLDIIMLAISIVAFVIRFYILTTVNYLSITQQAPTPFNVIFLIPLMLITFVYAKILLVIIKVILEAIPG